MRLPDGSPPKSPRLVGAPKACCDPPPHPPPAPLDQVAAAAAAQIQGSSYLGWNVNSHVNARVTEEEEETAPRPRPRGSTAGHPLFILQTEIRDNLHFYVLSSTALFDHVDLGESDLWDVLLVFVEKKKK